MNEIEDNEEIEEGYETLDLEVLKQNIPTFDSQKLCDMIVCDRYLGFNNEAALMCMEELATRRINGDAFDFETYIEEAQKDLPVLDFSIPDLRNILSQVSKVK